jgi:hypothetical protein
MKSDRTEQKRMNAALQCSGSDQGSDLELARKFWLALMLYAALAALSWFTLGEGKILVGSRLVQMRLLPLVVLGGLAFRTVVARQADKIRRDGDEGRV